MLEKKNCEHPDHKNSIDCFDAFKRQLIPRDSDELLVRITNDKFREENPCDAMLLKFLLIKLRRYKCEESWLMFKNTFESNHEYYINMMNSRWLISILETYADHDSGVEASNAMLATTPTTWDKIHQTVSKYMIDDTWNDSTTIPVNECIIYSGIEVLHYFQDDTIKNHFRRIYKILNKTPIIFKVFDKLVANVLNCEDSILMKIDENLEVAIRSRILEAGRRVNDGIFPPCINIGDIC